MFVTKQLWGDIDYYWENTNYYGSEWCSKTVWIPAFFKTSSSMFDRTKKLWVIRL